MASVGGLSGSTSNSLSSIRGYGGLASGLDRDTLIESMTYGTKSKIQKQFQQKQKLQWKQEAIRGISTKMIEFSRKYTSYSNPATNLSSSAFFSKSQITASGANSSKVTVTGNGASASNVTITGIKQLATNTTMVMGGKASVQSMSTGALSTDMAATENVSNLEGETLQFKYGNKTFALGLSSGTTSDGYTYDYSTTEKAIESINKQLGDIKVSTDKSLADVIEATKDASGNLVFQNKGQAATAGNTISISGGSERAIKALGLNLEDGDVEIREDGMDISSPQELHRQETLAQRLGGKNLSFTYNGTTKSVKLPDEGDITSLDDIKNSIQTQLDKAFGKGRIEVTLKDEEVAADGTVTKQSLQFQTLKASDGSADPSSVLSMSNSDFGVLGKTGALKVDYGTANRLNLSTTLKDSGLATFSSLSQAEKDKLNAGTDELDLTINGTKIEGLTYSSSISSIISAINKSDAGVKVSYLSTSDRFVMEATSSGASGEIKLEGAGAELLFGKEDEGTGGDYKIDHGVDAVLTVKYAGSDEEIELVRGSNSFSLDKMNVTLNETFSGGDPITLSAKVDADKITKAVSEMIDAFNEVLELANKEVSTKPDRNYAPLTDEQKEGLSDTEIEKWETEAKKGLLFNNSDIRSLTDSLRFIFPSGTADKTLLDSIGITTSTSYTDNGKLVFDETKFRAALESDPESVEELFTRQEKTNDAEDKGGFMTRISALFDKFASTSGATKGILVEQAGSTYAPTSILSNSIQKQIDSIEDYITTLNKRLTTETDRYIQQFTTMETLISQMNSQSSYLSQFGA